MDTISLDGRYQVTSTSNYEGPLERRSDGITEIRGGKTSRTDGNNVVWTSSFIVLNESEVEMISIADPSHARGDFALTRPDGSPTREPVEYRTILKLARKGDRIQMSGRIEYGHEVVLLTLRKTGD
jgi:hypothetical protein